MELLFTIDPDTLTWDDWIALEEAAETLGSGSRRDQRDFLARYLCNEQGQRLEPEAARKVLGSLPITQIPEAFLAFMNSIKRVKDGIVSPPIAGS